MKKGPGSCCVPQLDTRRSSESLAQTLRTRLSGCWDPRMQEFRLIEQHRGAPGQISSPRAGDPASSHHQVTPSKTGGDLGEDSILHRHPFSLSVHIHQPSDTDQVRTATSFASLCSSASVCPFLLGAGLPFPAGLVFLRRAGAGRGPSVCL